jgi:signal transduction histidine kinase
MGMSSEPEISWSAIAKFVRQFTHDVRNQLNGLELEAALIAESLTTQETMESLARIREQLHHVAGNLKALSSKFAEPSPTLSPITAVELYLIFKEQAASMENLPAIDWTHTLQGERINVDATELANVAKELLVNARDFCPCGRLEIRGSAENGNVIYEFREPKSASVQTALWGRAPFHSTRRDGYGLGLWEVRRLVEANNGKITHEYEPGTKQLLTSLRFPIA